MQFEMAVCVCIYMWRGNCQGAIELSTSRASCQFSDMDHCVSVSRKLGHSLMVIGFDSLYSSNTHFPTHFVTHSFDSWQAAI